MRDNTFMGCTGRGIPKAIPVNIFQRPEKTRVVERDIELLMARAIMRGRRVPRSPKDPDISAKGECLNAATLFFDLAFKRWSTVVDMLTCR